MQQLQISDQLSARWRAQVDRVTDLAVRRHSIDDTDPLLADHIRDLDAELELARQVLLDIEADLMQARSLEVAR